MEQERKEPWFLDWRTHRFKLIATLPFTGSYTVMSLAAYGVTPRTVRAAIAITAFTVGLMYLSDYLLRKMSDE